VPDVNTVQVSAELAVEVPVGVVCQNQLVFTAGEPFLVKVTPVEAHCGPLLKGTGGAAGSGFTFNGFVVALQPVSVFVYVKVTLPGETAVAIPAFVTVATAGLLLTHVPPVVGDKVMKRPTHKFTTGRLTTGKAVTVKLEPLEIVPVGVTIVIKPVVAVFGNVAVICVSESTTYEAVTPLNVTEEAPVNSLPVITTDAPELKHALVGAKLVKVGTTTAVFVVAIEPTVGSYLFSNAYNVKDP
jgi:hypothetical protein